MTLSPVAKTGILIAVGVAFATAGLVMYFLFPQLFRAELEKRLALSPTSETYEQWKEPSIPIYLHIYFFNITNPLEVYKGATPVVEELGPYSFREIRSKRNITWNENGTVSFRLYKKYYFQPDLTNGTLDDEIVTVNVPLLSISSFVEPYDSSEIMLFINGMLNFVNSTLFIKARVRHLLFDGYNDTLLQMAKQAMPEKIPIEKFGWFYNKNDTDDGSTYTVYTGQNEIKNFGYIDRWNGMRNLSMWNEPCNTVHGTTGEMWPPFRESRNEKLDIFLPDLCRTVNLRYISDQEVRGIEAYRYWLDNTAFDNGKYIPDNACYCKDGNCLPAGGHDMSICQKGAPVVMSSPHFLYGDVEYTENMIGLKPDPKKHKFYIDLQPEMGIPLRVEAKLQLNVVVKPSHKIFMLQNVTKTYYPVLWFSQNAAVNDELARKIQLVTQDVPYYVTVGSFLLVIVGGIFLTLAIIFAVRFMRMKKEKKGIYTAVKLVKA